MFSASSGVLATYPSGVAMPCEFIISIEMYSWTFRLRTAPRAGAAVRRKERAAVVASIVMMTAVVLLLLC